jgi:MHS family alpha-ketoglutarate permease-like MFS transporter
MTAAASDSAEAVPLTFGRRLRSIFGGSVGNLVEWYDWFAYSAFSLYFAPVFFPRRARPLSFSAQPPCSRSGS